MKAVFADFFGGAGKDAAPAFANAFLQNGVSGALGFLLFATGGAGDAGDPCSDPDEHTDVMGASTAILVMACSGIGILTYLAALGMHRREGTQSARVVAPWAKGEEQPLLQPTSLNRDD